MAIIITMRPGANAYYYSRHMGAERDPVKAARGTGYYVSAVKQGAEPAGSWLGNGLARFGIRDGQTLDTKAFEALYGEFKDPLTGEYLGRPPRDEARLHARFAELLAAEPRRTRAREHELFVQARSEMKRATDMYHDGTLDTDKSIGLAFANAIAEADAAKQTGDLEGAAAAEAKAHRIWAGIEKATRVYVEFMQNEARITRTGHHGKRIDGVEQGRFEDTHEIPVAIFPQHTNRNGDVSLHVHVLFLNKVETVSDGQWRALDSRSLYRNRGAAAAIAAFQLETDLAEAEELGYSWRYREKSHGRVIAGVSDKQITAHSSRLRQINDEVAEMAAAFRDDTGQEPTPRQLHSMGLYASRKTRARKPEKPLDLKEKLRDWERTSRENDAGTLADVGRGIREAAQATPRTRMTPEIERRVMAAGLALAQQDEPAWSRATLLHCLGRSIPDGVIAPVGRSARETLEGLADRVLAGETGEPVHCLTAAEFPRVPERLRRRDGESVYRAPGGMMYATASQLTMEERLLTRAQEDAPRLAPDVAAKLLGSTQDALDAQLQDADAARVAGDATGSGLRLDQAACAYHAVTSSRRGEVIIAAAGTGKTTTAGTVADVWRQAGMGRVYGVAASSAARNHLGTASPNIIPMNLAQFLGHLPGEREARPKPDLGPNALILFDEASMGGTPDAAAVYEYASQCDAKVLPFGDHRQLTAVGQGGWLEMQARKQGYVQENEPVRFQPGWQRDASIQLRDGDPRALAAYDAQGRLHGGTYEEMAEGAVRGWLRDFLDGKDALMTARSNAETRDLSRRAQEYLQQWGRVDRGPSARLREGIRAHAGDLIMARQNAGAHLINSDLLRVERVTGKSILVRRAEGWADGQRVWSAPRTLAPDYVRDHCDLAYAATWMTAQGSTVHACHSLTGGNATRNGFYESMTRGRDTNHAWAYETTDDCDPREDPVPELTRARRRSAERRGEAPGREGPAESADPVRILGPVLQRPDEVLSATETRERSLANADHLGVLWTIWQDQARQMSAERFTGAVREVLPEHQAAEVLGDTDDLFRALRAAELRGKDGPQVLAEVIGDGSLDSARSIAAVLASRVRARTEHLPAPRQGPWAQRVPAEGDPETREFLQRVGQAMDGRIARIGPHAAEHQPAWATGTLGPVPADPAGRERWERGASQIGAYREISGHADRKQALPGEPRTTSPELNADWNDAFAEVTFAGGAELDTMTDGQLLTWVTARERALAGEPVGVSDELRAVRKGRDDALTEALVAEQDAVAAFRVGDDPLARVLTDAARIHREQAARCDTEAGRLEPMQEASDAWGRLNNRTVERGQAAQLQLQRRGVAGEYGLPEPPAPLTVRPADEKPEEAQARILADLGLTGPGTLPAGRLDEAEADSKAKLARAEEALAAFDPGEDEDAEPGEAWWSRAADRERGALLQPPVTGMPPAPEVTTEPAYEAEPEAGA